MPSDRLILSDGISLVPQEPSGASQVALVVRNLPANAGDVKRCGIDPWVGNRVEEPEA